MDAWTAPTENMASNNIFLHNPKNSAFKVVGGNFVLPAEFPYQLQLKGSGGDHKCGATLITTFLALTAAHCVDEGTRPEHVNIISGQHLSVQIDGYEQSREVSQIILHENFKMTPPRDDIALLVLSHDFELDDKTSVARIPNEDTKFQAFAYITGWGHVKEGHRSIAVALKKAPVPLISLEECRRLYDIVNKTVAEKTMCAGARGFDACQGDSGGPLTCIGGNREKFFCGIVSWGLGCGRKGFPTVYTAVVEYLDWIQAQIKGLREQNLCPSDSQSRRCTLNYHPPGSETKVKKPKALHHCSLQQFHCRISNRCIPLAFRCDEGNDCGLNDNSDETDCPPKHLLPSSSTPTPCVSPNFECKATHKCLPRSYLCDGDADCGEDDLSDEDCHAKSGCHFTQFACGNAMFLTRCLPISYKCDGDNDCGDNSDEANCSGRTAIARG